MSKSPVCKLRRYSYIVYNPAELILLLYMIVFIVIPLAMLSLILRLIELLR